MITAVVPVSPIKSHPDPWILEQTVDSIRFHLPSAEIIVTFDGVREEQESRREDYEEFQYRFLWNAKRRGAVYPIRFEIHQHQTGMMRAVLDEIRTPLLMYVEQDTPLVTDEPINWDAIQTFIWAGYSNLVRLYHEAVVPEPHRFLMHDYEDAPGLQGRFLRTSQWSQRPHIASVAYYRRILDAHFSPDAKCFIEDKMHSVVQEAFNVDGHNGWLQHRIHIYDPDINGNMKRSYHLDGRDGEPKYDETQVW